MAQDNLNAYAQWLVQNKDRRGTPEFNKVAQAFQMLQAAGPRQSEAPVNPPGTGLGRAFKRGVIGTEQGYRAGVATGAANTLESMDVDRLTTIKRALGIVMPKAAYAALEQEGFDGLDRVASEEDLSKWFDSLDSEFGIGPQNVAKIKAMVGGAEAAKAEYREPGGKFDQVRERGQNALTRVSELQADRDALPMSPTAQRGAQDFQDAEGVMDWARKSFEDPLAALAFIGETAAESGPAMAAGVGTSVVTGNPLLGAGIMIAASTPREYGGEVMDFLRENDINVSDPQAIRAAIDNGDIMAEAQKRGLTKAAIISAFEAIGMKGGGGILLQGGKQAFTGGAGEAASQVALDGEITSAKEVALEAVAELATTPGEAAILYTKNGTIKEPNALDDTQQQAAGDLARTFKAIAAANPDWSLTDIDKTSAKGARAVVDTAHVQLTEALKQRFADMKSRVKPNQADTFESVSEKILAQAAYREGRNKTKNLVGNQELDALRSLAGDTREGQEAINLILQLNQLTELHNSGYQGGLSAFTDQFSLLGSKVGYDKSAVATERLLRPMISGGAAVSTGGLSIPAQMAVSGGGRAIDKLTGNYSQIDKFVRRNADAPGLATPTAPSLRDEAAAQLKADEDAKLREEAHRAEREAEQRALNLQLVQEGAPATPGSPQYTLEDATGLSREGVARILRILKAQNKNPALTRAIADYEQSVATGGIVEDKMLSPLIRAVRQFQQENPDYVPMVRPPNSLSNPMLAAAAAPGQAPNVDTTELNRVQAQTFGPQLTTPENYNNGIEANRTAAQTLSLEAQNDADLSVQHKAVIASALDKLQGNLGANPVMNAEAIMEAAVNAGVPQEAIDAYVKPYVDRVARQQSRPSSATPGLQAAQEAGVAPTTKTQAPVQSEVQSEAPVQPQENYTRAVDLVTNDQKVSASYIQRKLNIPYDEAADIVQRMENEGIVSAPNQVGARKILRQAPPRMAMAPQEDAPAVNPKKPQAPRLAPDQIPTQTRKVYKLMKVQKSRPGEVLPLFAKSGGHKGSPSGYTFGEWFGAEVQRPKLGDGLLAMRPGIHAVNLPVFDQGKAKVSNEQRVWVEVEIPAITEQTQAESDNSPILPNGSRSGVTERLIEPNESYDYKTNPNASNDAGGWPITGSMKALRIVPDAEIEQILRDNGLDHQVKNSFSDVDEAKAQELMQPATPVRMAMAPEDGPKPIPRGETTNIQMPNELGTTFDFAKNSNFAKGRDFKVALQEKALAAQKEEGIDLSELSDENINRLADYVVADALVALQDNANAIGWYDRTVSDALASLAKIYPEIQTNPANRLQFIWALAVTSNGTKVDKNFELAATAYDHLQRTGRFPTDIGIGEAARAINGGLEQYHTMLDKFGGDHVRLEEFMNSQVPVKQIEQEYGVQISGEGKNTLVRGASILGPKIGNGFFSNLYGNFDALTMDRWLMRTVGRHRGTLININMPMVKKKTGEIKTLLKDASPETMKALRQIFKPTGVKIGKNLSTEDIYRLAVRIAKESTSKPWREGLNGVSSDLRKAGNALAKYLDGQVEAPAGAKERDFIRAVFTQALGRLNTEPSVTRRSNQGLTMSDLQALLWYPEKRLYDTAKAKQGEESRGYADDEAPDYANAARKLAERRQANAEGNRLGSPGPDGPGGGGASNPNARQSQPPVTDGVAGILASRLAGGPAQRASVPSTQEVKQAAEPVRAIIEVGKKGSKYEDGIKDIDQVHELADAINVTLKMYSDQKRMAMDAGSPESTQALGLYTGGTAYALTPSASRSEFQSYITALHEVAHGLNDQRYSPGDMRTFSPEQQQQLMGTLAGYPPPMTNKLTGRKEQFRRSSFDQYIGMMLSGQSTVPKDLQKKMFKEIQDLQDHGKYRNGSDVRYEGGARTSSSSRRPTPYYKYIRSSPEFAVDPVIYYLHDPKGMKKNYPVTAEAIREFFRLSTKVQFYSHPLAMAFAVALAMLMKAEQEDEQEKQMPPGALNQPMMPGALSA